MPKMEGMGRCGPGDLYPARGCSDKQNSSWLVNWNTQTKIMKNDVRKADADANCTNNDNCAVRST